MQWCHMDHMQTVCTSLQTHNHTTSLNFYRFYALPDAQPTVSKHWRHAHIMTETRVLSHRGLCARVQLFYSLLFRRTRRWVKAWWTCWITGSWQSTSTQWSTTVAWSTHCGGCDVVSCYHCCSSCLLFRRTRRSVKAGWTCWITMSWQSTH